jgi:hypothetical protein
MKINAVSEFAQGMKAVGHDAPFDSVESSKSFFQTHNVVFTQFAQIILRSVLHLLAQHCQQ